MQAQAATYQSESLLFSTLLQLAVIVVVARLANVGLRRLGQPGAVGEILAGLLLGPSLLGYLLPNVSEHLFAKAAEIPVGIISQIGLILLMFQVGSDFEFGQLAQKRNRSAVMSIAAASIAVPLLLGGLIGWLSAPVLAPHVNRITYCSFLAVAMAITAVPTLGRILRELDLTRTRLGVVTITAAAINDVVGWILLAVISAAATSKFSFWATAAQFGGIVTFGLLLWWGGRPAVGYLLRHQPVANGNVSPVLMSIVLGLLFFCAMCTYALGIFAIFGGFAAGLLFHENRAFVEAWRRQVGQFVLVFFLPIFFTYSGLRTNVLGLATVLDWEWCIIILLVACVGKIVPVYFAARHAGLLHSDALSCGVLMNTRALMELIVLNVGYELGYIPQSVFTMMVLMAIASTFMTVPLIRVVYRRGGQLIPRGIEA
jgi:Kef-type K+ transport system membrane component KefB